MTCCFTRVYVTGGRRCASYFESPRMRSILNPDSNLNSSTYLMVSGDFRSSTVHPTDSVPSMIGGEKAWPTSKAYATILSYVAVPSALTRRVHYGFNTTGSFLSHPYQNLTNTSYLLTTMVAINLAWLGGQALAPVSV